MPEYRVYTIAHGHIAGASAVVECANDEEAITKGKQMVDGHDLELWQGAQLVTRVKSSKTG
ncbi:MAG: hypothetical protein ACR2K5_02170 [Pseudolabrys sp.]